MAWRVCAAHDGLLFATTKAEGARIGFIAMGTKDGDAYLEQISVLPTHMRRGVRTRLMTEAAAWSARRKHRAVWLTTYDHLAWNRSYYERLGFAVVPAADCGPDIAAAIAFQRTYLPEPDRRVAMRKTL